jgi:uncharacterized protein
MSLGFLTFLSIGFLAQLVDGALGMAFGVISTTFLLNFGLAPAHASAVVHLAEVFTTGASAISHVMHKNINQRLVIKLALSGAGGAITGAYVLSNIEGRVMRPLVAIYLFFIGVFILLRAARATPSSDALPAFAVPLGLSVASSMRSAAVVGGQQSHPLSWAPARPRVWPSARLTRPSFS